MRVNFTKEEIYNILEDMLESGELGLGWNRDDIKEFELDSFKYLPSGRELFCIVSYSGGYCKTIILGSDKILRIIRDRKLKEIGIEASDMKFFELSNQFDEKQIDLDNDIKSALNQFGEIIGMKKPKRNRF